MPRLSTAMPILQPSISPWWSLASAQLSGEEEQVGWHKMLPSLSWGIESSNKLL